MSFGKAQTATTQNFQRQNGFTQPPNSSKEGSVFNMAVFVGGGISGLSGFGLHRFFGRGAISGLKYLAVLMSIGGVGMFFGVTVGDAVGKPIWGIMILFFLYGIVESLVWAIVEAMRLLRDV